MNRCGFCGKSVVQWAGHSVHCTAWRAAGGPAVVLIDGKYVARTEEDVDAEVETAQPRARRGPSTIKVCRECGGKHYARGLCRRCYQREYMRKNYRLVRIGEEDTNA